MGGTYINNINEILTYCNHIILHNSIFVFVLFEYMQLTTSKYGG